MTKQERLTKGQCVARADGQLLPNGKFVGKYIDTDELGGVCDALGIDLDNSGEAANIIGALLNAFGDQKVYWHRKTNTIYLEYTRRVTQRQILKDEHLYFSAPRPALVTDDAEEGEELVVYYNPATMGYFARPARLFDDESRFVPLAGRNS